MNDKKTNRRRFFAALLALPWAISAKPKGALPLQGRFFREPERGYMVGSMLMSAVDERTYSLIPCSGHIIDFAGVELTAARYDWEAHFRGEPVIRANGGRH